MPFDLIERLRVVFRPKIGTSVAQDADDLLQIFGPAAYDAAVKMAWRESTGLLDDTDPGHWGLVRGEIALRQGIQDDIDTTVIDRPEPPAAESVIR